jgi:uncharacterized protein YkwD
MVKKDGVIKNLLTVYVILAVFISFSSPSGASALAITKENVIELTNQSRLENGAAALIEHPALSRAAQNKAEDMITRQYWSHYYNGQKPWDWMDQAGYEYIQAGENLAIDFVDSEKMNQAWLDSESHRKNMLNGNYQHIGIGIASGWFKDHDTIIVVQMFGKSNQKISKNQNVDGSQFKISADYNDQEQSQAEQTLTFSQKLKNIFKTIGEKTLTVFESAKEGSKNSISWIGELLTGNRRVFAD